MEKNYETLHITFRKPLAEIDKEFEEEKEMFGVESLKEFIAYLRNPNNPSSLYVKINGKRRRLFINRQEGVIGIIAERKKRKGYRFYDWASIQAVYYPTGEDDKETVRKEVLKYKKLARLASHTNAWLRQIADADPEKSLYENHITTGTTIDGKCIRLSTIEKYCGCMVMECFREAFKKK